MVKKEDTKPKVTKVEASTDKGGSKMTKKEITPEPEATNVEEAPVTEKEEAVTNGNGKSNGARDIKLADMPVVKLTKKAFGELDGPGLVDKLIDPKNPAINRISRERAHEMLVTRIKAGKIKITNAAALMDLTYKRVVVAGVTDGALKDVRGVSVEKAPVKLTAEEFAALKPAQIANYVGLYTHKRSAAGKYIPAYIRAGMPMTAENVVWLTCGRVAIAGVELPKAAGKKSAAVTDGVSFG